MKYTQLRSSGSVTRKVQQQNATHANENTEEGRAVFQSIKGVCSVQ